MYKSIFVSKLNSEIKSLQNLNPYIDAIIHRLTLS